MKESQDELKECLEELLQAYACSKPIPPVNKRLSDAIDAGWLLVRRTPGSAILHRLERLEKTENSYGSSIGLWLGTSLGLLGGALGMQALVLTDSKIYPAWLTILFCIMVGLGLLATLWFLILICKVKYQMIKLRQD